MALLCHRTMAPNLHMLLSLRLCLYLTFVPLPPKAAHKSELFPHFFAISAEPMFNIICYTVVVHFLELLFYYYSKFVFSQSFNWIAKFVCVSIKEMHTSPLTCAYLSCTFLQKTCCTSLWSKCQHSFIEVILSLINWIIPMVRHVLLDSPSRMKVRLLCLQWTGCYCSDINHVMDIAALSRLWPILKTNTCALVWPQIGSQLFYDPNAVLDFRINFIKSYICTCFFSITLQKCFTQQCRRKCRAHSQTLRESRLYPHLSLKASFSINICLDVGILKKVMLGGKCIHLVITDIWDLLSLYPTQLNMDLCG